VFGEYELVFLLGGGFVVVVVGGEFVVFVYGAPVDVFVCFFACFGVCCGWLGACVGVAFGCVGFYGVLCVWVCWSGHGGSQFLFIVDFYYKYFLVEWWEFTGDFVIRAFLTA